MNVGRVAHLFEWSWTADDAAKLDYTRLLSV